MARPGRSTLSPRKLLQSAGYLGERRTRWPSGTLTYCCQVPTPPEVGQGTATTRVPSCNVRRGLCAGAALLLFGLCAHIHAKGKAARSPAHEPARAV